MAAFEDTERRLAGVQYHPEVGHSPHGQEVLRRFLHEIAGIPPSWTTASIIDETVDGGPRAGRRRSGDLRAVRRGRLRGRGRARPAGHRGPADLRVRRPRAAARRRAPAGGAGLRRRHRGRPAHRGRGRPVPRRAGRGHRPRAEAQDHRPRVHPGLRGGRRAEVARRRARRVPGAGHALPGRGGVRRRIRYRDDQEPPQRRRAAGRPGVRAGRAAAGAVQGRGAPGRRRARAARDDRAAAAVPRARAGHPDHRRGHRRPAGDAARGRRRSPARS